MGDVISTLRASTAAAASQVTAAVDQAAQQTDGATGDVADNVSLMSVYHPFPLRMDTAGSKGGDAVQTNIQYDACFQIGEFPAPAYPDSGLPAKRGNKLVIFVPLRGSQNPDGPGGKFINSLANKIPNILGAQPDFYLGYPEVPAATGSDWGLASILELGRPFYTWYTTYNRALDPPQTRVVVMSEPINISQGDLANIQRLPITPPEDAIHEIGQVRYHAAPPKAGCPAPPPPFQLPSSFKGGSVDNSRQQGLANTIFASITWAFVGACVLLGIYFGLKAAMGPVGEWFGKIGESMAAGMTGIRRRLPASSPNRSPTRRAISRALGLGQNFTRRTPVRLRSSASAPTPDSPIIDAVADRPPSIPLVPTGTFSVTNPGHPNGPPRSRRTTPTSVSTSVPTAAEIADRTPEEGHKQIKGELGLGKSTPVSASEVANKKPEVPLVPDGDFMITNPGYRNGFPKRTTTLRRPAARTPVRDVSPPTRRLKSEDSMRRMRSANALARITSTSTGLLAPEELIRERQRRTLASDAATAARSRTEARERARRERERIEAKINDEDDTPATPSWLTPSPLLASEQERSRQIDRRAGRRKGRKARKARKHLKTGRNLK